MQVSAISDVASTTETSLDKEVRVFYILPLIWSIFRFSIGEDTCGGVILYSYSTLHRIFAGNVNFKCYQSNRTSRMCNLSFTVFLYCYRIIPLESVTDGN